MKAGGVWDVLQNISPRDLLSSPRLESHFHLLPLEACKGRYFHPAAEGGRQPRSRASCGVWGAAQPRLWAAGAAAVVGS